MSLGFKELLPYQRAWVTEKAGVAVGEKGRRTGLTWSEALAQVLLASASKEAGGMNCHYLAYNKEMTKDFIQECANWAMLLDAHAGSVDESLWKDPENPEKDILIYQIRFGSGHYIQALPSKKTALRSKQGRVCIDEAAFVEDLDGLMKSALALRMWGGSIRVISTHDGADNPFNLMVQEVREGRKPYALHRIDLDDALEQGLYKKICEHLGQKWSAPAQAAWRQELIDEHGDAAAEELFCHPSNSAGSYYPRALVESCSLPQVGILRHAHKDDFLQDRDTEYRESWVRDYFESSLEDALKAAEGYCYLGWDVARTGDLSVLWILEREKDLELHTLAVVEMRNWPFATQDRLLRLVLDGLGEKLGRLHVDARGNGQQLAEGLAVDYPGFVGQVMITRKWHAEAHPRVKARLEDKLITIPRDTYILDDFRVIKISKGVPSVSERTTDADRKNHRHGDAAIAIALAVDAEHNDEGAYMPTTFDIVEESKWG